MEVEGGQVVGLLGRNGVGKEHHPESHHGPGAGAERLDHALADRTCTGRSPTRIPRLGIGYVPEDRRIFPRLTVLDNLRTGFDRQGASAARTEQLLEQAYASFPRLKERQRQLAGTLSGGEQQMLAIARAMMLDPQIVLLDEPTEGLMPRLVGQIREIIDVLRRAERVDSAGGAERAHDARGQRPRVSHGARRHPSRGAGERAFRGRRGHPQVPGGVTMNELFQDLVVQMLIGVSTGLILALVASGLTLIFGIMDVVNFAHGELFMLGAYMGWVFFTMTGSFLAGPGRRGVVRLRLSGCSCSAAPCVR